MIGFIERWVKERVILWEYNAFSNHKVSMNRKNQNTGPTSKHTLHFSLEQW